MNKDFFRVCRSGNSCRFFRYHLTLVSHFIKRLTVGQRVHSHTLVKAFRAYWSFLLLVGKFCYKVSADRAILPKLMLQPLRVFYRMLDETFICSSEDGSNVCHQTSKFGTVSTLMRCTHREHSIC